MPSKKLIYDLSTKTTSTGLSKCNDEFITKLISTFEFDLDFKLQLEIDEAESWYYSISEMPKKPTIKQTKDRLNKVNNLVIELKSTLSNLSLEENISLMRSSGNRRMKFKPSETLEYLNELSLITRLAIQNDLNKVSKKGRAKKTENSIFLEQLYKAFEAGSNTKLTSYYNNHSYKYEGNFVLFCEQVIDVLKLPIHNSSIGEFVKLRRKNSP
jgi:hypothetical protein